MSYSDPLFLYNGITLVIFNLSINFSDVKERLKISVRIIEISSLSIISILFGMLKGPVAFYGSRFVIIFIISSTLIGRKKKEFADGCFK